MLMALGGCSKQLLGSLDELTANQLVSTLRREGVNADKSPAGEKTWKVTVPDEQFADAVQIMERHNLPSQNFQGLGQVFKKESLVSTPTEERARLIHAMSQELERSLMQMDGVLVARVHPVILANDPLNPKRRSATASVLIKYRPGTDMNGRESMVRALVAAGVEGLSYDDVRVVMVPGDASATLNASPQVVGSTALSPQVSPGHRNTGARGVSWLAQIPPYVGALVVALLGLMALCYAVIRWRRARSAEGLQGRWADTVGALLGKRGTASPGRTRSSRPKIDAQ
jgi:type III secretion protein J